MAEIIIKESQLNLIKGEIAKQSEMKLAELNWSKFTDEEKQFVVEFLKEAYPKKSKLIKESWYNTLGDIVGIFDPTGVVDLVNGISYLSKGEHLFGFLSLISAIPLAGDIIAKPVMSALKLGKPSAKTLNAIMATAKAGDVAKASADLAKLSQMGGITAGFVKGMEKIGPKLTSIIERVPGGFLTSGLKKTILGWIDLFGKAGKTAKEGKYLMAFKAGKIAKLAPEAAAKELQLLNKAIQSAPGVFSGYRTTKGLLSWKTIFGGMPQLMGRNKSVRALMRQSKWWLGFLDYIGMGNFVGPDELAQQLGGEEEMAKKMEEYNETPQAKNNFEDQYGGAADEYQTNKTNTQSKSSNTGTNIDSDPFAKMISGLFKSALNPIPGM
jgi:hypothetical protein